MACIVGKLYSIYCENFVTYDQITVNPGKHLNLILGPNGTGKSSLVAAIVLGLGGEPKLLSRAYDIGDYVKNGKEQSKILIEVYVNNRGKTAKFERSFSRKGKSIYRINGATTSHAEYVRTIAKYDIQISNLCQFMPQDRVQDFAKMNPEELLNSTQEAICSPEMLGNFNKLMELRNIQKNGDQTLADSQKRLKELEDRNARLEGVIEKIQIRQKYLEDVEIGEKKVIWLEFDEIQKDMANLQNLIKAAKYDLKRDEKIFHEVESRSKNIVAVRNELSSIIKQESTTASRLLSKVDELEEKLSECENIILTAERDLKIKKAEMGEREEEIQKTCLLYEASVEDLKMLIDSCGPEFEKEYAGHNAAIEEKKKEIFNLTEKRTDLNQEIDHYQPEINRIRNGMNKIQNEGERLLNKLRQINEDAHKGVEWLRKNHNLFEGHVYEPMVLELRVKEAKNAMYVENTISDRDLIAFICTNKSDVSLLLRKLCNEKGLRVNVLHSDADNQCNYTTDREKLSQLRKYGFYSYLLDMVDGPAPILNYLCKAYKLEQILVATDEVEKHVDSLPREITFFYSSQNRFRIIFSRYSNESSSQCSRISEQKLLSADIDEKQLNEMQRKLLEITRETDKLKNKRSQIETLINDFNEQVNQIVRKKHKLEEKKQLIHDKKREVRYREQRVIQLRNLNIDVPLEEEKFKKFCAENLKKMLEIQKRRTSCFCDYQKALERTEYISAKLQVYRKETVDIENQLKSSEDDYKNARKRYEGLEKTRNEIKVKLKEKETEALNLCGGKQRNDPAFAYNTQFNNLPDTLQELEERLVEMKTRAECMNEYSVDLAEYESRESEIKQLRTTIDTSKKTQSNLTSEIKALHDVWYPYLMDKISEINKNFAYFMSCLEYAGEVNIIHNDVTDYDTYGILILVQYRNNAKLQALDRFIQSGGERAVAIALYSMSLQNLTHAPFRCVDEINQGMDPGNERKVFNLIVDVTCREQSSQYFFVTPKLLPGLHFHELMTALVVFNGQLASPNVFRKTIPS